MKETPWTVNENASVKDAMKFMIDKKIGGVPVVDDAGHAKGFVSDGDIVRYIANATSSISTQYALLEMAKTQSLDERATELLGLDVKTIATDKVVSLNIDDSIESALDLLSNHRIKKLPIIDDNKIIGTLNRSDILRFIMEKSLA